MTFPSSEGINPRLRAFFSSRFVVVDTGQSPGLDPAVELDGAGGAGAGGGASGAPLFGGFGEALAAAPPLAELVAMVELFFFTIVGSGEDLEAAAAAQRLCVKEMEEGEEDATVKYGKGENSLRKIIKRKET